MNKYIKKRSILLVGLWEYIEDARTYKYQNHETVSLNKMPFCSAVKEANPNGGDECALAPSIMECFHSHKEEVRQHIDSMVIRRSGA
jgi:hypothetical protein